MKIKELKDLRKKEVKELNTTVFKKRDELAKLKVKLMAGKEKNVKLIKALKKDIVQLLTVKTELERIQK